MTNTTGASQEKAPGLHLQVTGLQWLQRLGAEQLSGSWEVHLLPLPMTT